MNKNEFIAAVCSAKELEKLNLSKGNVTAMVEACLNTISEALKKGDEVRLVGFGNFYVTMREASKGRHPRTGEEMQLKASRQPKFRAGKQLKEDVNTKGKK